MGSENSKCPESGSGRESVAEKRCPMDGKPATRRKANSVSLSDHDGSAGDLASSSIELSNRSDNDEDNNSSGSSEQIVRPRSEIEYPSKLSDFDNRSHFMQRRERMLIVKSWKKTQKTGAEHVGSKIFLRVLIAQPDIKAIFGLEKIPQGRLKYDPRFRQHAVVFTKTFDYAVKNLEFADKLEHHFDSLGRRHVAMQGRGFDPSYWDTFAECMTQTAAEWDQHRHRPTTSAWRSLVSTIIMFMRRGYDDEMSKKRAMFPRTGGGTLPARKQSPSVSSCPSASTIHSAPSAVNMGGGGGPTFTASQAQELYQAYAKNGVYINGAPVYSR